MKTNKSILITALFSALSLALLPGIAAAQGTKTLHGHVPAAISRWHLQPVEQLAPDTSLHLAISLPLRNESDLNSLIAQIYDPSSTNYHRYLKPGEFANKFGPSTEDYQKVLNFVKASGLTVVSAYTNQMLLDVSGKASDIEKAFQVTLRTYHHPTENRDFYAPNTDPVVDPTIPIMHISGLDDFVIPHPLLKATPLQAIPANAKAAFGSGPSGTYMGNDFRAAYAPGVTLAGSGQKIALFELDGYFDADILSYEAQAGLPNITLTNIAVNGGISLPGANNVEVALDIDMDISMATNISEVIVYEAPNGVSGSVVDLLSRIASDDLAEQVSASWAIGDNSAYDVFYKQMALQGQSFFLASGDDGAFYPGIPQANDDTNVTLVGGTTLFTTGPVGPWSSETVWNWFSAGTGQNAGGGGVNFNGFSIPSWQQGVSMTNNQGSTTLRNVPDVALTADNIFIVADNGSEFAVGGTSAAAPLWAGFTALVNQQATNANLPPVGFLNPAIYAIGESTNYTNCFHDIVTGNNTNLVVGNKYFAVPGYDLCTGWGTPNGSNLINALTSIVTTNIFTHLSAPQPPYGNTLSALNGGNPNGNWYLFVQDDQTFNSGMVSNGWSVSLTTANPIGPVADVALSMSASPTNLLSSSDANIIIGVTNYGPSTSSNVVVADNLPLGFSLVSSNVTLGNIVPSGQTVTWIVGTLTNGAGSQITLTVQANALGTAINSAGVSAVTPDQNPADASALLVFNVSQAIPPSLGSETIGSGGKFQLTVTGASGPTVIQASTNLINWINVYTSTPPFTFTDSVSSGFQDRFYRALIQQ